MPRPLLWWTKPLPYHDLFCGGQSLTHAATSSVVDKLATTTMTHYHDDAAKRRARALG